MPTLSSSHPAQLPPVDLPPPILVPLSSALVSNSLAAATGRWSALGTVFASLLLGWGTSLQAQDVELLGRIHGVRPPTGYYETRSRDPNAFQLRRGWVGASDAEDAGVAFAPAPVTGLGPRQTPVAGTFEFPVVLGRFQDTDSVAYTRADVQREFFDGPTTGERRTIREYYGEASHGHVDLLGRTFDWTSSTLERSQVTGTSSGLGSDAEVGEFIRELLDGLDGTGVDWTRFDNDGPDGVPDSGDDDGYVDLLAVIHPTAGAECGNSGSSTRVWSHRWQLSLATDSSESDPDPGAGEPWITSSPAASPATEFIRVDDYMIAPLLECDWRDTDGPGETDINQIGVLAHELGHGFGLPDLYGTGVSSHFGAGNWDLMGTGAWGCDGSDPALPCLPGAWTKHAMGWVTVDTIPAGTPLGEVTLDPVETSGRIALVESNDGSGEYFLLENRRRVGFDQNLLEEGLLIWHVDPGIVSARWSGNRVNADPTHPGVWLRQADGLNELMRAGGGRGDADDAFTPAPGESRFHAGTTPSSFTHAGNASGLTLTAIRESGSLLALDLESTYHVVSLETGGTGSASGDFDVNGEGGYAPPADFRSAAFETHTLRAPLGQPTAPGIRDGFRGWADGAPCFAREFTASPGDSVLVASYGGSDVLLDVALSGPEPGIDPGSVSFDPGCGGWVPQGATVAVEAVARTGFEFLRWEGDFAGRENPFLVDAGGPLQGEAVFDVTYSVASNPEAVDLVAGTEWEIVLQVANGN
ncbi:MAG: M6 family metalloprotease domain-containing protein, partial [Longimicrobiales bacterium]|nr:M6 family metalloprotease domain-containing protein [Longimicrobiales bacterium]